VKIKVKKVNDYTRELVIDIPWAELESDFNDTIKKFSKKIKMPGFRAGKIPRERLLAQFQPNLEVEFMDTHFQKYYLMAIQQEGLTPVNKAEIKDVDFQMNGNFSFNATFEIEPELSLPRLKKRSLSVQRTTYIHDEQDIEDAIMQLRKSQATMATIEEGAIGGFGSHVNFFLNEKNLLDNNLKFRSMILPDKFIDHNKPEEMYKDAGLDARSIELKVLEALNSKVLIKKIN